MEVRLRIHAHSDHAHPDGARPDRAFPNCAYPDRAHPDDDTIEEHAFKRLPEADADVLEEHLLICETCRDRLRDVDEYLFLTKTVMAQYADNPAGPHAPIIERLWDRIWPSAAPRKPMAAAVWACGMATVLAVGWLTLPAPWQTSRISTPATITLAALRGGDAETVARGPAHRPLELSIDLADLPAAPGYRLELVTSTGGHAWGGVALASEDRLSAHVEQGLRAGTYWARLYSAQGELLREFGLRVD